ncbi:MAG: HD domain-containing protein [Spirochaetales bacterium]|uniref:HD domain-containing protein n=1 Tax=Candidatus Thalassospirochaeta sargassi TaxID=3119039 RepID=A0AAJ1MKZ9_9SPIO|nr:HD domain-containing protein [Spirochaetales bacterium]
MNSLFFENSIPNSELTARKTSRNRDLRTSYFRDTTAIIHSYPFRRLKHKTQVFFSPHNDHICTRIEHVMHVASIAATICRALDLDADLAWAIGIGHDLGHTPFGHVGETILASMMKEHGGFKHEIYSLRVVDYLANYGKGLNLTYAVRDGILNHCGEKFEQSIVPDPSVKELSLISNRENYPATWEGVIVRMSDKIAYMGRDFEDALQLKIISKDELSRDVRELLGTSNSEIIDTMVNDLITTSLETGRVGFSDEIFAAMLKLKEFNYSRIYKNPRLSSYHRYFERVLTTLQNYLQDLFEVAGEDDTVYKAENNFLAARFSDYYRKMKPFYEEVDGGTERVVFDYIAGMTDNYALSCVNEIMIPRKFEYQFNEIFLNE